MAQNGTPHPPHLPTSHRIWTNPKTGPWDKWGVRVPQSSRGYATGLHWRDSRAPRVVDVVPLIFAVRRLPLFRCSPCGPLSKCGVIVVVNKSVFLFRRVMLFFCIPEGWYCVVFRHAFFLDYVYIKLCIRFCTQEKMRMGITSRLVEVAYRDKIYIKANLVPLEAEFFRE